MRQKANLLLQPALVLGLMMFLGSGAFGQQSSTKPGSPNQNQAQNLGQNQAQSKDQSAAQASSTSSTEQSSPASASTADNAQDTKANSTADQKQENDSETPKHKVHVRFGGIAVGAGYAYSSGLFCCYGYPYNYGFYPYNAFYNPFFYPDPFYDFYGYPPYDYRNNLAYAGDKGEIRLSSSVKGAQVYIDGAYAGTTDKLKNFWLAPGAYNVSVSAAGRQTYKERVYVLSGKSVKLKATLEPEGPVHAQGEAKP
ncbi:MAG TPA: PEGA domain-containing protein [Candidatus Angelobacter sp.]|nr:PEGA domain-containing protein [Candidatus Angelobacter sp.]